MNGIVDTTRFTLQTGGAYAAIWVSWAASATGLIDTRQYFHVRVVDIHRGSRPVAGATIAVRTHVPLGPWVLKGVTDGSGYLLISMPPTARIPPNYRIRAQKAWHLPEEQISAVVNLPNATRRYVELDLQEQRFQLKLDEDRDGMLVNDTPRPVGTPTHAPPAWTRGVDGHGAVVPCNCNDDGGPNAGEPDNGDAVINANNDAQNNIARIGVVKVGSNRGTPAGWQATLTIESAGGDHVSVGRRAARIFRPGAPGGNLAANDPEAVGPANANYQFNLLHLGAAYPDTLFGMEAIYFAGQEVNAHNFGGEVVVRLTVNGADPVTAAAISYSTAARVRVAPWIMPSHLERSQNVYVANVGANGNFITDLGTAITTFNGSLTNNVNLVQTPNQVGPRWMQDCMEIGYANWPGYGPDALNLHPDRIAVVAQSNRYRYSATVGKLEQYPKTLIDDDVGFDEPYLGTGVAGTTFDSFGNLEVTPPVRGTSEDYPLGRIYHGRGRGTFGTIQYGIFNRRVGRFLRAQRVQAPIALDTNWLLVGHVDEMMSFVPNPAATNNRKAWKLLLASPRKAYEILDRVNGTNPAARLFYDTVAAADLANVMHGVVNPGITVADVVGNGNSPIPIPGTFPAAQFTWNAIRYWNIHGVQKVIDDVLADLRTHFDIDNGQIIRVPVIFTPEHECGGTATYANCISAWDWIFNHTPMNVLPGKPGGYLVGALTADMVNLVVIGEDPNYHCIAPKAFGPIVGGVDQFQDDLENALNPIGVTFIDDWSTYHLLAGEVHCGTNVLRRPWNVGAWLQTGAARWWEVDLP